MSKQEQGDNLSDDGDKEDDEEYPPWLQHIVEGEYYNAVRVVEEEEDDSQPGYVRCKAIKVPDAADAAERSDIAEIRRYTVKTHSVVMIIAEPDSAPYIGLVEKIWRDKSSSPLDGAKDTYTTSDFMLECYWFYRPDEVPESAWDGMPMRKEYKGAQFAFNKRGKPHLERRSPRQLLFSSHHTRHDYPDNNGLLSLEGFLQACEPVHWIGLKDSPPVKYRIHGGKLIKVMAPGFVVQGFLWCNGKDEPQLDNRYKRAYGLEQDWADHETTTTIVKHMVQKSRERLTRLSQRNEEILDKYVQHTKRKQEGHAVGTLRSESGGIDEKEEQRQQAREGDAMQLTQKLHSVAQGNSDGHDSDEDIPLKLLGKLRSNSASPGTGKPKGNIVVTKTDRAQQQVTQDVVRNMESKSSVSKGRGADLQPKKQKGVIGRRIAAKSESVGVVQQGGSFGPDDDDD